MSVGFACMMYQPIDEENLYLEEKEMPVGILSYFTFEARKAPEESLMLFLLNIHKGISVHLHYAFFSFKMYLNIFVEKINDRTGMREIPVFFDRIGKCVDAGKQLTVLFVYDGVSDLYAGAPLDRQIDLARSFMNARPQKLLTPVGIYPGQPVIRTFVETLPEKVKSLGNFLEIVIGRPPFEEPDRLALGGKHLRRVRIKRFVYGLRLLFAFHPDAVREPYVVFLSVFQV